MYNNLIFSEKLFSVLLLLAALPTMIHISVIHDEHVYVVFT